MGSGYELIRSQVSHDETTKEVEVARSGENDLKKRIDHVESLIVTSSDGITSMNGYDKNATGGGSILTTDSLNIAMAKLDNKIDSKASGNHTHNYAGSNTPGGAANSALKLETTRRISLIGEVQGSVGFDGSTAVEIDTTLKQIVRRDTVSNENPNDGNDFSVIDRLITDGSGRVVEVNTKTITLPSDTKVKNVLSNNVKAYVTGTTEIDTNTGTQVFNRGVYLDTTEGHLTAVQFNGLLNGSANSSSKLTTPRNINGTAFDGTQDIVTNYWGASRQISISDFDNVNVGNKVPINGSSDITLKLPSVIKADLNGNADTTTRLQNSVNINGTAFDGSKDITVEDDSKLPLAGGTLTGQLNATAGVVGDLTGNSDTATTLETARDITIGNLTKSFDGSSNIAFTLQDIGASDINHNHDNDYLKLIGGTVTGNINATGGITGDLVGNSTTTTRLQTPRTINGVPFDGTRDIDISISSGDDVELGGYVKPNIGGGVTQGDTLNEAIGKLEFGLDQKAPLVHNQASSTINAMTGYVLAGNNGAIAVNDTLNVAIAKLENSVNGKASVNHNQGSNTINAMSGYIKGAVGGAITAADGLNEAISKLEVNLDGKADIAHTHNYLPLSGGTMTGVITTPSYINFTANNAGIRHNNNLYLRNNGTSTVLSSMGSIIYFRPGGDTVSANQATLDVNGDFTATKFIGNLQGNADSATRLQTPRRIELIGDVTGQVNFDGTGNVTMATTVVGGANVRLNRINNDVTVNNTTTTVNIGIPAYNQANDILNVYLAGVRLRPGIDYNSNNTSITGIGGVQFFNGDVVSFEVIQIV